MDTAKLEVFHSTGRVIFESDDQLGRKVGRKSAAATSHVGAFHLVEGIKDASILTTRDPGAQTTQFTSHGTDGVAPAEIYDASYDPKSPLQWLANISSRAEVTSGVR
jgi:hypothetical protein